jgi:uncharacterized protein (DUF1778 family)
MHLLGNKMPTNKPRITITLSDEQHELLHALAELQKVSMSSIVVELLDTSLPVLERLVSILKAAAAAPQSVLDGLRKSLEGAEENVLGKQADVMAQFDLLAAAVGAGDARERTLAPTAAATGRKTPRPPPTNRGVRIPSKTTKTHAISPMKTGGKARGVKK